MSKFNFLHRTLPGDGPSLALEEGEVVVWKSRDFDEIKIEFADRCARNGYSVQVCRLPNTDSDCQLYDTPTFEETHPTQLVTGLQSCTAYSFTISAKTDIGNLHQLYKGFHRTQASTLSDFEFVPQEFDIFQNSTSISLSWRHVLACVVNYKISANFESAEKFDIYAPDLSKEDLDSMLHLEISEFEKKLFKQCRHYNLTILPILNSTEFDEEVNVVPYQKTILFYNEPTAPEDVSVIEKSTNYVELGWTHYPECYLGYHVTVTRAKDSHIIHAVETK